MKKILLSSLIVIVALSAVVSVAPKKALAATTATLTSNGQGSATAWNGTESDIDETGTPSCSTGDYIDSATNNARESVNIDLTSVPNGATINSVEVLTTDVAASAGTIGGTYKTFVHVGSDTDAAANLATTSASGCTARTQTIDITDFVKSAATDLEVGVLKVGTTSVRVGTIRAIITYTNSSFTITATAGAGGTITPSGAVAVSGGSNQSFAITPNAGNIVSGVTVDAASAGTVDAFTFSSVTANHTISAVFDGGWSAPSTFAFAGPTGSVTNPGNAFTSNNSYAVFDTDDDIENYGTFGQSIPAGSTINGIEVAVEGKRDSGTIARVFATSLSWNNGTSFSTAKTGTDLTTTEKTVVLGTATDKWGTHTWVPADFNNGSFVVRIDPISANGNLSIDQIQIKVFYSDITAPVLAQVTPVPTPSGNNTPSYTFSSTEAGTITYGGDCSSSTTSATVGNNTVTFNSLANGTHSNCTITVKDISNNSSLPLAVSGFTIDGDLFAKGMVSLSFDDGTKGIFTTGMPIVHGAGFKSTQYIISGPMNGATECDGECFVDFMTQSDVQSLYAAGDEIAVHTRTHLDLTTLTTTNGALNFEVDGARLDLLNTVGKPMSSIAYPYGAASADVVATVKAAGLSGGRTVTQGFNTRSTDRYMLFGNQVLVDTPMATVEGWIDQAISQHKWLILVFHKVDAGCTGAGLATPDGTDPYCITPANLAIITSYLQSKGSTVSVPTVGQGLALMNNHPVSDNVAPIITQADITVPATSAAGAPVAFAPVVTDSDTALPATLHAFCTIPNAIADPITGLVFPTVVVSGATFPVGVTTVTCTSADAGGNLGTKTFTVTVEDAAPVITGTPVDFTVQATSAAGATATYTLPTALDIIDGARPVTCAPNTGTVFAFGPTLVTCSASDLTGHTATTTFTVTVSDTVGPVVTLSGANPMTIEALSGPYVEPGVTSVLDAVDGDLSASLVITGGAGVNTNVVGTYLVNYDVTDTHGNTTHVVRTVNVVDTTKPIILLSGTTPVTLEVHTPYTDAGATATDNYDLNTTSAIVTVNPVNVDVVGDYTVTYNVIDAHGNIADQVTRLVRVVDTTKPVIALIGAAPFTLEAGTAFVDPGSTVTDNYDSGLTATVDASAVNIHVLGSYVVTYNVTDAHGNIADQVTRTVNVVDTVNPVVSVTDPAALVGGHPSIAFAVVDATTVTTECKIDAGSFVACTSPFIPTLADGPHTVTVRATDAAGLTGEDTTAQFTVDASAPTVSITSPVASTFVPTAAVTVEFVVTDASTIECQTDSDAFVACTSPLNLNLADGSHTVTVRATDSVGNVTTQAVTFTVDSTNPVLAIDPINSPTGAASITFSAVDANAVTFECHIDADAFAACTSPFAPALADGGHVVTVRATDAAGHQVTQNATFTIDSTLPGITINSPVAGSFSGSASVAVNFTAEDGTTLTCQLDGAAFAPCDTITSHTYNGLAEGSHTVTVKATDAATNSATDSVTFIVDTSAPVIAAHSTVTAEATSAAGATVNYTLPAVTDTFDPLVLAQCTPLSGTAFALGNTTVTCTATDTAGNVAISTTFVVTVQDTTAPVITLTGSNPVVLSVGDAYIELGANVTDAVDGAPVLTIDSSAVDVNTFGSYEVTYNAVDAAGNHAVQVVRTVNVGAVIGDESAVDTGGTSVNFTWTTNHPTTSRVIYDTVAHNTIGSSFCPAPNDTLPCYGYTNTTSEDPTLVTSHSVTITGLTPGTTYFFRPVSHGSPETVGTEIAVTPTAVTPIGGGSTGGSGGGGGGGGSPAPTNGQVLGATDAIAHPNGTLILDGSTIYLIKNGQRYGFRDAAEYQSHGYKFTQTVPANSGDRSLTFNLANIIKALPGTLVLDTTDNHTVYMIGNDGSKRGFSSAKVFTGLGYAFNKVVKINLADYPVGAVINSSTEAHPDGSLVLDGQTVWWILGGTRQGFESEAVFNTYGFSYNRVVKANASDLALPVGALVKLRDGTLVVNGGVYYLISDGQSRKFTSTQVMTGFGYKLENSISTSLANYTAGASI